MKNWDIYLLTESRYLDPKDVDWYVQQILEEDGMVQAALESQGARVKRVDWADENVDWKDAEMAVFRTTWDYFERFAEFEPWFDRTSKVIRFINSAETIRWNMDKHYLLDLREAGIPIVPSLFIEPGEKRSLQEICDNLPEEVSWKELILKPCVSGAARHTYRFPIDDAHKLQKTFEELIAHEAMMIQPFQESILSKGEHSHMVMDGRYTHSILKKGKDGDFRVQDDFGGTVHPHEATQDEVRFAEGAMRACLGQPLYGRVDVMYDMQRKPMVSEVELVEPELWFRNEPRAAELLAEALMRELEGIKA